MSDKVPVSNRLLSIALVAALIGVSAVRTMHRIEIGLVPFDRVSMAIIVAAVLALFLYKPKY